jgi:phenylacetate-CoA ligase
MESQYWPAQQMLEFQRSQLRQLLKHAKETVPFYKTRLDCVFNKNGDMDWDRWNEIPIVTRADLRDRRDEMLTTSLPEGHGPTKTIHSSGSSGVPVSVEVTKIWSTANQACIFRFLENQGIDTNNKIARLSNYDNSGNLLKDEFYLGRWGKTWANGIHIGQELIINRRLSAERTLQLLESFEVPYLNEIPNNAELLAMANLDRKVPVRLQGVICIGQEITADQRNLFSLSFGARSISVYSSTEGALMGCQWGDSTHFHLNAETVLVEILDSDGKACSHKEPGRVVITPFFSTSLPLIRYDQGDIAETIASCTCNSKLPALDHIMGRQDQLLQFPDGKRAVFGLDQNLLRKNLDALAFQLAQVASLKLEIRYLPAKLGKQISREPVIAHIREIIHPKLEVVFKQVEKIPLNPGGKQQRVVCEI